MKKNPNFNVQCHMLVWAHKNGLGFRVYLLEAGKRFQQSCVLASEECNEYDPTTAPYF
jgi:hypothetical protein